MNKSSSYVVKEQILKASTKTHSNNVRGGGGRGRVNRDINWN